MGRLVLAALLFAAAAPLRAGFSEAGRALGETSFGSLSTLKNLPWLGPVPELPKPDQTPRKPGARPKLKGHPDIHSALDFAHVSWPSGLTEDDKTAFEVALNISGSFEGGDAWANLTGNFDGQGMSMGLLNQCLGQGSLQPLLILMRNEHPEKLKALISPDHLKSLFDMLDQWQGALINEADASPAPAALSIMDEAQNEETLEVASANKASVAWAVATLYSGAHFEPVWKAELTALASDPDYVSLQIAAALNYHLKAVAYEAQIGVRQFRSYLMLFDIVVQNGGLYADDLAGYDAYVKSNPKASGALRLEKLLELRLKHVRKRFEADVLSRKRAIIRGTGSVHGEKRNLPVQYNYDPLWAYR